MSKGPGLRTLGAERELESVVTETPGNGTILAVFGSS